MILSNEMLFVRGTLIFRCPNFGVIFHCPLWKNLLKMGETELVNWTLSTGQKDYLCIFISDETIPGSIGPFSD